MIPAEPYDCNICEHKDIDGACNWYLHPSYDATEPLPCEVTDAHEKSVERIKSEAIRQFIIDLDCMSGTGNGIGMATVKKIQEFAVKNRYIKEEQK